MTRRPIPTLLASSDTAVGVVLAFSPPQRLSGPGLTTALDLLPAPTWGALFVAAGVLVFYGRDTVQEAGLWLAAVWYGFFAATLCYSIVTIPTAGLLGLVWCVTCLAAHMITATWRAR